jgi:hypothetical protein
MQLVTRRRRPTIRLGFVTHVTFLGTFDVHRSDWRALLRIGHKRQKTLVLRMK